MEWLWRNHAESVEFVVLFGSRARGDAMVDSDYDLVVGLRHEDRRRFVQRIGVYQDTETGRCDVFPYTPSELDLMERDHNELLLEALADGAALFDRGAWRRLRGRFQERLDTGLLRRSSIGWEFRTAG